MTLCLCSVWRWARLFLFLLSRSIVLLLPCRVVFLSPLLIALVVFPLAHMQPLRRCGFAVIIWLHQHPVQNQVSEVGSRELDLFVCTPCYLWALVKFVKRVL